MIMFQYRVVIKFDGIALPSANKSIRQKIDIPDRQQKFLPGFVPEMKYLNNIANDWVHLRTGRIRLYMDNDICHKIE